VLKRILGRSRNLLKLPDGQRFWPRTGGIGFDKIEALRQFQIVQTTLDTVEVRLVCRQPLNDEEENHLRDRLQQAFKYPFTVEFRYMDEIPRSASGKFEDLICMVAD
jgi:phenylacetate-CoA ligase